MAQSRGRGPASAEAAGEIRAADRSAWPVVLVCMPFMEVYRPSIQLGLLKAIGTAHGFPVSTLHANLDFAARIGVEQYQLLSEQRSRMAGDWLFSVEAFGASAPDPLGDRAAELAAELAPPGTDTAATREALLHMRRQDVPAYLDALVDSFPWQEVRAVGFSSTFQQNAACFALARRLKHRWPGLVTIFGGANFDGPMGIELVRTVECIDLAVIGEGDVAFPRLLDALARQADPCSVPGVARRVGGEVVATPPARPLSCLDESPVPDYDEYFERARHLGLLRPTQQHDIWIPLETSRGCWWGAKHHCTFCGLNATSMSFRAKSPERVLTELAQQARRYRSFRFEAVDNILDTSYLSTLFPRLVETAPDYELFYEVKANLTRAHLRLLAQAGVRRLQPGIESLSSQVLALMRKGVRAAQNVNTLRWARYYGMRPLWNLIWGFPGETDEDYRAQAAALPHLVHLAPPEGSGRIWLERFSPLYGSLPGPRIPQPGYAYVYPREVDLDRVAYFFEYPSGTALPDASYEPLRQAIDAWVAAWQAEQRPALTYWSAPGFLQIYDARYPGREGTYTFEHVLARIYLACSDRPMTASAARERLGLDMRVDEVRDVFHEFAQRGLMFLDGQLALSLALPAVGGR